VVLLGTAGKILANIEIPFERPRHVEEISATPEFRAIYQELWHLLGTGMLTRGDAPVAN
jgi:hypothetical protein